MRAAVVYEHGPAERVVLEEDYPEPDVEPGWVKLRVRACSLNFHDIFSRRGMPGIRLPLPLIIGSDVAGEIVELGPEVRGWSIGQRILVDPISTSSGKGMIGEAFDGASAMLVNPARQVGCHADIECTVRSIGHDVDPAAGHSAMVAGTTRLFN